MLVSNKHKGVHSMKISKMMLAVSVSALFTTNVYAAVMSPSVGLATQNYINQINEEYRESQGQTQAAPTPTVQNNTKNSLKLTIDGVPVKTDSAPVNVNGRILVPMRAMFEAMGATVQWNPATQTATATKDGTRIQMTIGSTTAYVNGTPKTLDVPAQTIDGRTMIPSRFIGENLNYNVGWNSASQTVELKTYQNAYNHLDAAAHGVPGVPDGWFKINGSPEKMLKGIANGYIVYVNGQHWASPEYANMVGNETVVFVEDVSAGSNTPIYNNILKPDSVVIPLEPDHGNDGKKSLEDALELIREQQKKNS